MHITIKHATIALFMATITAGPTTFTTAQLTSFRRGYKRHTRLQRDDMQLSRNLAAAAAMSMPPAPTPHYEPTSEPTKSKESPPTGSPTFSIVGDNVCTYAPDHKWKAQVL